MNKQQLIDNYFERKEQIKKLTKGEENELHLDKLSAKIKDEVSPGIHGDKNVSLVPIASSPYLNYEEVKSGVSSAVWEKIKPFIKMRKESVNLFITRFDYAESLEPADYRKSGFKMAVEKINKATQTLTQMEIDELIKRGAK